MGETRKARAVRALVRPDRRDEYLRLWERYSEAARELGATVRLFEDQLLPGRFLELTEHLAAEGMEAALTRAASELRRACVRREGDDVLYREARPDAG
jgi:hypothetical protein